MSRLRVVAFLPARYGSTRLPGKPLLAETGKPLIQHTWERVRAARTVDDVVVATDDERIAAAVRGFGGRVALTGAGHASGTDRIGEAVREVAAGLVLNVQGDEPEVEPAHVDALVEAMTASGARYGTLATPLRDYGEYLDSNRVKVTLDARRDALFFSRAPIPHAGREAFAAAAGAAGSPFFRHLGLYAYTREFLLEFVALPPSPLERLERLEQLRALEAGVRPRVAIVEGAAPGIDTLEDYRAFVARSARRPS